ncbi:GNAT family N-acetyltransferase [Streptomyces sp. TR02-1]|uniref:GNAT family N-acetyltransferase n=1 Tax=Streptomyces sp. TR02-1 TaxID=3385977 RepID=UPI0039A0C6DE
MKELRGWPEVERAAPGDSRIAWAAQERPDGELGPGVRAWRQGSAVVVASPDLSGRDRLAVTGEVGDTTPLVRGVLDEVGPSYRIFGPSELVDGLVERIPGLGLLGELYWMEAHRTPRGRERRTGSRPEVVWLDTAAEKAAEGLFDHHFPRSYAQPGRRGVKRWAGILDDTDGSGSERPVAVAAEAWSSSTCGFMAGVVTHPEMRGKGLSQAVCAFLLDALVSRHGRAALMVHRHNAPAVGTYRALGMTGQALRATSLVQA